MGVREGRFEYSVIRLLMIEIRSAETGQLSKLIWDSGTSLGLAARQDVWQRKIFHPFFSFLSFRVLCSFSNYWPKLHRSPSNSISLALSPLLVSTYFPTLGFGTSDGLVDRLRTP